MNPLVSIIIPLYNRVSVFEETIKSVLQQTYPDWECLIIDDHSTDGSYELAKEFSEKDKRVKVYKREGLPKGAPRCRNEGINLSEGKYIIFLDSDDLFSPFCLERRMSYCNKNPQKDFVVFPVILFRKTIDDLNILQNIKTNENDLDRFIRRDIVWLTSGPIWKKQFLLKLNGFDETLPSQQEYDLHVRALLEEPDYSFENTIPDTYYRFDASGHEHIGKHTQLPIHLKAREKILEKFVQITMVKNQLSEIRKIYFAQYFLHLAWMWSWHQKKTGRKVLFTGLRVWEKGRRYNLFSTKIYIFGCLYIMWKNFLFLKRTGNFHNSAGNFLTKKLDKYIFRKSKTQARIKLEDLKYE